MSRTSYTGPTRFIDANAAYAAAIAASRPAHLWVIPNQNVVWLLTDDDAPNTSDPYASGVSREQLLQGALVAGGAPRRQAVVDYVADRLANGTPVQRDYWQFHLYDHRRNHVQINQLRLAIQGAKTNLESHREMDSFFVLGAAFSPATN